MKESDFELDSHNFVCYNFAQSAATSPSSLLTNLHLLTREVKLVCIALSYMFHKCVNNLV